MNRSGNAGSNPQRGISLVVPLQDEESTIESLLRSIAAQTLTPNEIVLVDAGCRDATFRRAAALGTGLPLRVVSAGRVYPGAARNAGVEASTHEWIAFTDGGVVVDASWLAGLVERADPSTDVVYGNYEPVCDSFFRECAAIAYVSARDESATRGPSLASCLVRRDAFTRAGGFPPFRAAEDLIFIQRLIESGARTAFAPKASVRWQIAGSVPTTFRRFASYSYHNLIAGWGRHWHAGTSRLYAALGIVILGAASSAARPGSPRSSWCFSWPVPGSPPIERGSRSSSRRSPHNASWGRRGSSWSSISPRSSASRAGSREDPVEAERRPRTNPLPLAQRSHGAAGPTPGPALCRGTGLA